MPQAEARRQYVVLAQSLGFDPQTPDASSSAASGEQRQPTEAGAAEDHSSSGGGGGMLMGQVHSGMDLDTGSRQTFEVPDPEPFDLLSVVR